MTNATQVEKDIANCIDYLDLDDNQIGEMLRVCEELGGISAEYFCDEVSSLCVIILVESCSLFVAFGFADCEWFMLTSKGKLWAL